MLFFSLPANLAHQKLTYFPRSDWLSFPGLGCVASDSELAQAAGHLLRCLVCSFFFCCDLSLRPCTEHDVPGVASAQ